MRASFLLPALLVTLSLGLSPACNDGGGKDADGTDGSDGTDGTDGTDGDDTDTDDGSGDDDTGPAASDTADTATAPQPDPDAAFVRLFALDWDQGDEVTVTLEGSVPHPSWEDLDRSDLTSGPFDGYVQVPSGVQLSLVMSATDQTNAGPQLLEEEIFIDPLEPGDHVTLLGIAVNQSFPGPFGTEILWALGASPVVEAEPSTAGGAAYTLHPGLGSESFAYDILLDGVDSGFDLPPTEVLRFDEATPLSSVRLEERGANPGLADVLDYVADVGPDDRAFLLPEGSDRMRVLRSDGTQDHWIPQSSTRLIHAMPGEGPVDVLDRTSGGVAGTVSFLDEATTDTTAHGFDLETPTGAVVELGMLGLNTGLVPSYFLAPPPPAGGSYAAYGMDFAAPTAASGTARYRVVNLYPNSGGVVQFLNYGGTTECSVTLDPGEYISAPCDVDVDTISFDGSSTIRSANIGDGSVVNAVGINDEEAGETYWVFLYDDNGIPSTVVYDEDGHTYP